jgi:hypothetical protein
VERVDVAVDEAGRERHAGAVEHLGPGADVLAHGGVVADGDDRPVAHGDGGRTGLLRVQRAGCGAQDREVGWRHGAAAYSRTGGAPASRSM